MWQRLKKLVLDVIGPNEVLFLGGMGALFVGIKGLWNFYGALAICGAVLVIISVFGIVFANKKA